MNAALPIGAALMPGERESLGSSAEHRQTGSGVQCPPSLVIYLSPCTLHTIPISHMLI